MKKIIPHLWYDKEARQATELYTKAFNNSQIIGSRILGDTPSGDAELITFELEGQLFYAISAGDYFKFNPSVSFMVACESVEEVDRLYNELSVGGKDLMPLGEYDFSPRYVWFEDQFGLSWQLMLSAGNEPAQKITPCLLFSKDVCGKAQEAMEYYGDVFPDSGIDFVSHYPPGAASESAAKINYAAYHLYNYHFCAMDNGYAADYGFNEAVSFMVICQDQAEIDYFWEALSHVPEAEQCGWLKDQFGLSWQIVPDGMGRVLFDGTPAEMQRVTEAFLKMKKFDLYELELARRGVREMSED